MERTSSEAMAAQLRDLLPSGPLWPRQPDTQLMRYIGALAHEFAELRNAAVALRDEADPRSAYYLMPDWERVYNLPDPCAGDEQTLDGRRRRLVAAVTARGGQNNAYYIPLAQALGYAVEIVDYAPSTIDGTIDDALWDAAAVWCWTVKAPLESIQYATIDGTIDDPLSSWGNAVLECWFRARQPRHGAVFFAYIDPYKGGPLIGLVEAWLGGGPVTEPAEWVIGGTAL